MEGEADVKRRSRLVPEVAGVGRLAAVWPITKHGLEVLSLTRGSQKQASWRYAPNEALFTSWL